MSRKRKPTPRAPSPRPTKLRRLLRRPLRSPAEAERLSALIAERRLVLRERGRFALVAAASITVLAMMVSTTGPDTDRSEIMVLPSMFILATAVAMPMICRRLWANPRLLAAQRRLLADRGLAAGGAEEPEAVLADLEQRIDQAAALLSESAPPEGVPWEAPEG